MRITRNTGRPRPDIGLKVLETMMSSPMEGFVGLTLFPILLVDAIEGSYQVAPISALMGLADDKRAADGSYNRGSHECEYGYYITEDRGLEGIVDRRAGGQYGALSDQMFFTAALKTRECLRAHDKRCADMALDATKFTATAAAAKWDTANSKPRNDVTAAIVRLRAKGVEANILTISYDTYLTLCTNADVQSVVYQLFPDSAKSGVISQSHLELYFKLPVAISKTQYNASEPGKAAALTGVWDKTKAWVGRVRDPDPALMDHTNPHVGNTFLYNEGQSATEPWLAEDYPEDRVRSDIIRVRADLVASYTQSLNSDLTPKSEVYKACGEIITTVL